MKILFLDIDGYVVKADIQSYVSQIELFGDEPIKDFEYIKNCIKYMLDEATKNTTNKSFIEFIQKVYNYVSINMFEMLKEYRDCFLEYDNLRNFQDKMKYLEDYQRDPIVNFNSQEEPTYMKYIINALEYAKTLIENEYIRVQKMGGTLNLPFSIINEDNDIIEYTSSENPLKRAESALKRMEIYAMNREKGRDDFLTACYMIGDNEIVNYNDIYIKENLMPGVVDSLKHLIETKQIDMIVACSHYTGPREAEAKYRLFREELPFVLMLPESLLKFHLEPAIMGKRRERSSKNNQIDIMKMKIANLFGYDLNSMQIILGDDSSPNLDGLKDKQGILYRMTSDEEKRTGILKPTDERFIRQFDWSIEEIDRVFANIYEKENNKVLRKKMN